MNAEAAATHGEHPRNLAHHFDNPTQQYESGKLGMWLFLGTEVLMFGGLFCAYTIFRANHPEIFHYGHRFLDVKLGAINTVVLICSSLTMAWAVRAAQLGQKALLMTMLALTLACACGFMGIKFVEYRAKFEHGLLMGTAYRAQDGHGEAAGGHGNGTTDGHAEAGAPGPVAGTSSATGADTDWVPPEPSLVKRAAMAPTGLAPAPAEGHAMEAPANPQIFFGIYFAMTGLHGFHVLAGMVVITMLLVQAGFNRFGPDYYTPVDLVGLYWHIVDMIWIFLFPLLYLID